MMTGVVFFPSKRLERYTIQISTYLFKTILCYKNNYVPDTRMRWTYSVRKRKATGYVYLNGPPYRDAEGSSQLRSCIHDAIINAAPRIGKKLTNPNSIDSVHLSW